MDTTHAGATAPVVPGYSLTHTLGVGSAGEVWAAQRTRDGLQVAVKVVQTPTDARALQAARELAVLSQAEVEGLVRFHEALGLDTDPPAVAIVLDQVIGGSLMAAVRARGHLSVGESVTVLTPVARTLAGLHALGVVHGDVSPSNVLLERNGRPLVADLGVARLVGELPEDTYGTAGFVAPEVVAGATPSTASDVYAVGALAWWCVTGAPPGPAALRHPLHMAAPGLPEAWASVTTMALAGDPAQRPTAAELALAYFDSAPCEPLRLVVGADDTSLLTQRLRATAASQTVADPPRKGSWRRVAAGLVLAGLGLAGLGVAGLGLAGQGLAGQSLPGRASPSGQPQAPRPGVNAPTHVRPEDPAADRQALHRDPRALMQSLSDLRAQAINGGRVSDLVSLDVAGSPAMAADGALRDGLAARGRAYRGVRLLVRSAQATPADPAVGSVDAVVDTAAYEVVGPAGATTRIDAAPGAPMRFWLRWQRGRWRIERIAAL